MDSPRLKAYYFFAGKINSFSKLICTVEKKRGRGNVRHTMHMKPLSSSVGLPDNIITNCIITEKS
jgi:hypothetical protein